MDEGLPIAYEVLEPGVPVFASGGEQIGTVAHVVAAPEEDIFHGIVMNLARSAAPGGGALVGTLAAPGGGALDDRGRRFVPADQVASLHEHGVDLRIDAAAAAALPEPHGGAPAWRDVEPGVKPSPWKRFIDLVMGRDPRARSWDEED